MVDTTFDNDRYGWRKEGQDLLRAVAAGAIVGMPLLYTMEMWWHGMMLSEWHLLMLLGLILLSNFLFSLLSGFRREESSLLSALFDSITSVGIGIVFSAIILWLIGELGTEASPTRMVAKVLIEAAAVSIGVAFANDQIGGSREQGGGTENGGNNEKENERQIEDPEREQLRADLRDVAATLAGALVFALNIAPTEEVLLIASRLAPLQQVLILAGSLLLFYIILFASGFAEREVYTDSLLQHPVAETLTGGALSLLVACGLMMLLGQRESLSSPAVMTAAVITLGLPAMVGGAAGRIIA